MARIFDNADEKFEEGLHAILTNAGVERADFCTGYFNLRGWKKVAADVEDLPGGEVFEMDGKGGESSVRRICRLLVGMHRPPTSESAIWTNLHPFLPEGFHGLSQK